MSVTEDGTLNVDDQLPAGGQTGQVLTKTESGEAWQDAPDGLPEGGETGQVLTKTSTGAQWDDIPSDLPAGGTDGQILTKTADGVAWEDAPEAGVTSFKGRTGAVTPQEGDYTAAQVGAAKPGVVFTVTLTAAGWSSNSQTVSDERFLASGYAYVTNPADDDFTKWGGAIVRGQDVTTNGQMTFTCEETPEENITVKIIRLEADEA